jgi:hypothetical protein
VKHEHLANLVFFLLWAEQHDPKQMWGGIHIGDAIDSLAAIMNAPPAELRRLIGA